MPIMINVSIEDIRRQHMNDLFFNDSLINGVFNHIIQKRNMRKLGIDDSHIAY